jgi:hypothetical protein
MALGGGSFTNYNKVLPGTYVNFVSASSVSGAVSDRGVATVAVSLSWGAEGEMFAVEAEDFMTESTKYFGYAYGSDEMKWARDLFLNASKAYIYRVNSGVKAKNTFGEAKYSGVCGNKIKIKIAKNIDNDKLYDVTTYYNSVKKDCQSVESAENLVDNDFVTWNKSATLSATAGSAMSGGSDKKATGEDYQNFLNAAEGVEFNVLGTDATDESVKSLVASFTKRMREDQGVKFQSVLYDYEADDEGVINVCTSASSSEGEASLVWFVTGAAAGCAINKSLMNMKYNGNFTISTSYTQTELEECIKEGKFVFHKVDDDYRVLADINSLVTVTAEKSDIFCENQTVRIIDQIASDDAALFKNKYLGVVPNDEAGRISLWSDIVQHRRNLEKMRAIENFSDDDITVQRGDKKTAVVISGKICPINSMEQLYITTTVE